MSNTKGEPTVPLSVAEMLYVCLATAQQSSQLDARTKETVGLILATYRVRRDMHVKKQGYDEVDVRHYSGAAAEALANWLDDRAAKVDQEDEQNDFVEFERQFDNEHQTQDSDQDPVARGERTSEDHDGAGGVDPASPEGGGWSPDGGTPDPRPEELPE